jgi:hypothetical protein
LPVLLKLSGYILLNSLVGTITVLIFSETSPVKGKIMNFGSGSAVDILGYPLL